MSDMKGGIVEAMTEKNSSVSVMGTRRIVIWYDNDGIKMWA